MSSLPARPWRSTSVADEAIEIEITPTAGRDGG